ncbi:serine hydrolase domain-containing protein [Actinophytocola sp.]|uniref:serine hydrolase domain-containing protein n=1 Tax=Actinophytocola sp. TaxID=1872138 RepID=UPI002ED547EA
MTSRTTRRSVLGMAGAAIVSGAALSGTAVADTGRIPDGLKPGGELDQLVADMAARDEFSGSLLLTHRRRTVLARSYGMANKARSISNGPDTVFGLASVAKLITGIAIGQLAQARRLAYTDPLGMYLDGFASEIADAVTIHHLLVHTSGLGDYMGMPGYWETARTWTSAEQALAGTMDFIRQDRPASAPGASVVYSNSGYFLLGEIAAKVCGQPFADYLREHVFLPPGMNSTDSYTKPQWRDNPRIARPYRKEASGERVDTLEEHTFLEGVFSTCGDMARLADALLGNKLLTPAVTQLTLNGKLPSISRGPEPLLDFQAYGGQATLSANNEWSYKMGGGSSDGASTDFAMYPDRGWVVVILSNYDLGNQRAITRLSRQLITQ